MSTIRVLLFGLSAMLSEIISTAITADAQMRIVPGAPTLAELGKYTRRRHIDAVIFASANPAFADERIDQLLQVNPRLCLMAVDGRMDRAIVHFLAPSHAEFPGLEAPTLAAALRAGTGLRLDTFRACAIPAGRPRC